MDIQGCLQGASQGMHMPQKHSSDRSIGHSQNGLKRFRKGMRKGAKEVETHVDHVTAGKHVPKVSIQTTQTFEVIPHTERDLCLILSYIHKKHHVSFWSFTHNRIDTHIITAQPCIHWFVFVLDPADVMLVVEGHNTRQPNTVWI